MKDSPSAQKSTPSLERPIIEWRSEFLDYIAKLCLILSAIMISVSFYVNYQNNQYIVIFIELISLINIWFAASFKRASFKIRSYVFLSALYIAGLALFVAYGFYSSLSMLLLLGYTVMAALILGEKAGYFALVHLFITLSIVGILDYYDVITWQYEISNITGISTIRYVNCFIVISILTLTISKMVQKLQQSLINISKNERQLEERNKELAIKNDQLDQFMYRSAHDMRAPLSSILGLINITRHDIDQPRRVKDYLNRAVASINKLDLYLKDLVDLSKNIHSEMIQEEVHFNTFLDKILLDFDNHPEREHIVIDNQTSDDLIATLDVVRLKIVMSNLISNGIKYRDKSKAESFLKIRADIKKEHLEIVVADNGLGINEENLDKIFDLFYRGHLISNGSGIGLHIVKDCIARMKGKIDVRSVEMKGTTFILQIPEYQPTNQKMLEKKESYL